MQNKFKVEINQIIKGRTARGWFESVAEAEAWIDRCKANNSWGKPARSIIDYPLGTVSEELKNREGVTTEEVTITNMQGSTTAIKYHIPCEYEIEILNKTVEYEAQQAELLADLQEKDELKLLIEEFSSGNVNNKTQQRAIAYLLKRL